MRKSIWPLAMALTMATLPGCYAVSAQADRAAEPMAAAPQDPLTNLSGALVGAQRDYARAYTRATWVHAGLSAGDWKRAEADLTDLQADIQALLAEPEVAPSIKGRVNMLMPTVFTLRDQITSQDRKALRTAGNLVSLFRSTTDSLVARGWLGTRGGGAGAATPAK